MIFFTCLLRKPFFPQPKIGSPPCRTFPPQPPAPPEAELYAPPGGRSRGLHPGVNRGQTASGKFQGLQNVTSPTIRGIKFFWVTLLFFHHLVLLVVSTQSEKHNIYTWIFQVCKMCAFSPKKTTKGRTFYIPRRSRYIYIYTAYGTPKPSFLDVFLMVNKRVFLGGGQHLYFSWCYTNSDFRSEINWVQLIFPFKNTNPHSPIQFPFHKWLDATGFFSAPPQNKKKAFQLKITQQEIQTMESSHFDPKITELLVFSMTFRISSWDDF